MHIYIYIHIYTYTYDRERDRERGREREREREMACVCTHVFVYICVYVCVYTYIYIYINKYTHIILYSSLAMAALGEGRFAACRWRAGSEQTEPRAKVGPEEIVPTFGRHYLSNATCLIQPHWLHELFIVSMIMLTCYILHHL